MEPIAIGWDCYGLRRRGDGMMRSKNIPKRWRVPSYTAYHSSSRIRKHCKNIVVCNKSTDLMAELIINWSMSQSYVWECAMQRCLCICYFYVFIICRKVQQCFLYGIANSNVTKCSFVGLFLWKWRIHRNMTDIIIIEQLVPRSSFF